MNIKEGMEWDGVISFGVIDETSVERLGLMGNVPELLNAIRDGRLKWKREIFQKNKVTNYARQTLVQMITGGGPVSLPSQMELGTGTGTPSATDSDLWSPNTSTLKQCSNIQQYLTYYAQFITTWQTSDPIQGTWTEVGLKDINNNLWAHAAITSNLTVNSGEMLVGQWQIQILGN